MSARHCYEPWIEPGEVVAVYYGRPMLDTLQIEIEYLVQLPTV